MTAAVTIPADLAADVAAHPDRYRPDAPPGADVLSILPNGRGLPGRVVSYGDGPGTEWIEVDHGGGSRAVGAWALVGSVDGGPRPDVGQRVLVLECGGQVPGHTNRVGVVEDAATGPGLRCIGVDFDADGCAATRWALLPDHAEPAARITPLQPGEREVTLTHRIGPSAVDGNWFGGRPDAPLTWPDPTLPPGALPARQLDTGPRVVKLDQDATADDVAALVVDLRHQLAAAEASLVELLPTSVKAERDRYRATLEEIARGRTIATGDDGAAVAANHRRDLAREVLAGDPPADQADAELDDCTICGGRLDDDPPAGSPCADGHDARDPVGTIPAGALAVGDRVRITTGGVVDVERDDDGTGETD